MAVEDVAGDLSDCRVIGETKDPVGGSHDHHLTILLVDAIGVRSGHQHHRVAVPAAGQAVWVDATVKARRRELEVTLIAERRN